MNRLDERFIDIRMEPCEGSSGKYVRGNSSDEPEKKVPSRAARESGAPGVGTCQGRGQTLLLPVRILTGATVESKVDNTLALHQIVWVELDIQVVLRLGWGRNSQT